MRSNSLDLARRALPRRVIGLAILLAGGVALPASAEEKASASNREAEAKPTRADSCYRIAVERHPSLCKQFARNLNLFCDEPPMQCGVKVHPSMKQLFTQPKWEAMDPVENFDIVVKVYSAQDFVRPLASSTPEQRAFVWDKWREMEPEVRRLAEEGSLKLSRARFDPMNVPVEWTSRGFGKPLVYRVEDPRCGPLDDGPHRPSPLFAVLDQATGEVDERYGRLSGWREQPIIFKGGYSYLVKWWPYYMTGAAPQIHLTEPTKLQPLCEFNYVKETSK